MKTKALRVLILCIVAAAFMVVGTAGSAYACANEPQYDFLGDLLVKGNVGVGTNYPDDPLHIWKGSPAIVLDFKNNPTNDKAELVFSNQRIPAATLYWNRLYDKIYLQNLDP